MAMNADDYVDCRLGFYDQDDCKSRYWSLPLHSESKVNATFYSPYSYFPPSCSSSLSNDWNTISTDHSSFTSSRRSSNISPITSMSEDGAYPLMPNETSKYMSDPAFIDQYTCIGNTYSSCSDQPYPQPSFIKRAPCGLTNCWEESDMQICPASRYTGHLSIKTAIAFEQEDLGTRLSSISTIDPPLSTPILFNDASKHADIIKKPSCVDMMPVSSTVTPSATFHQMLSSSPGSMCPVTPSKGFDLAGYELTSSPTAEVTPMRSSPGLAIKSDWDQESKLVWSDVDTDQKNQDLSPARTNSQVRHKVFYRCGTERQRRKRIGLVKGPKSAANERNYEDEPLIPNNEFFCSYPNCRQSNTKRTSFRRQEHLKRHEKTVHGHDSPFICRFCSRQFNRNDNLKQHYKTHSKNAPSSRNHWVAVLDENSPYHDPDFEGPITRDGYPIRDGIELIKCPVRNCVDIFHTHEALRAHEMKKEHRQDGAGKLPTVSPKSRSTSHVEK